MAGEFATHQVYAYRPAAHAFKALRTHFYVPESLGGIPERHKPPVAVHRHTETDVIRAVLLRPVAITYVLFGHENDPRFQLSAVRYPSAR